MRNIHVAGAAVAGTAQPEAIASGAASTATAAIAT